MSSYVIGPKESYTMFNDSFICKLLFFKLPQVQMGFEIYGFPNFKKIKVYLYHILCSITNTVLGLFHNKNILTFMKQHVHSPRVRNFKKL